jgi:hypothetical protein
MSSPGNNPPHVPRVDPNPGRQDAHEAKLEAEALKAKSGEDSARPWYKRLFTRG